MGRLPSRAVAVGSRAALVGFLVAGFGVAAALSRWNGDEYGGVGDLVAVVGGSAHPPLAAVTGFDFFAVTGVVLVSDAGPYLVANGLGVDRGQAGSRSS